MNTILISLKYGLKDAWHPCTEAKYSRSMNAFFGQGKPSCLFARSQLADCNNFKQQAPFIQADYIFN